MLLTTERFAVYFISELMKQAVYVSLGCMYIYVYINLYATKYLDVPTHIHVHKEKESAGLSFKWVSQVPLHLLSFGNGNLD